ncbi:MAG: phosphatidylinositol kinase [Bacteroidetes bacterium HGW-Bacteroidetes-4]|jgi:serine/threonine-protein kinase HipA|nr:MAG: phosphatidylinositol kinase [Bacteroidetes bacterium HGW-Bacteroidetes-4]
MRKCLYCYKELNGNETDFHSKCSQQFFGSKVAPTVSYTVNQMAQLAKNVVERSISVPGVQPKLSVSFVNDALDKKESRLTIVGALGGAYIFKPPTKEFESMPENEHVTMRLAELFEIRVVPSSLIRLQSGELGYITKRIDRTESGQKIHMLDMFQILEAFDKYKGSMEKIGKALEKYSANPLLDKLFLFELTLFSFLTGNSDMHLKNFSMFKQDSGWQLAPAYDLLNVNLVMPEDKEELALTLEGKKLKITKDMLDTFGQGIGLNEKQLLRVYQRFFAKQTELENLLQESFLNDLLKRRYLEIVLERYQKLNT